MEVVVEDLSSLRKSLKVEVSNGIVAPKLAAAYQKIQGQVSLKGFRKGKTPMKVLEQTYNERVQNEVSEALIQDTYFDALAQTKLDAMVHPDIKSYGFNQDGSFSYVAEIEIRPQFELGAYKGIEIEHPSVTVSEEELNKSLELTRREVAPLRTVSERGVGPDDLLVIDFQGYEDGKELSYVSGVDSPIDVGSGRNGKEFETMLLGLNRDEESHRQVTFPADFASTMLAGKTIDFTVTVKDIKERILPAMDDEFAKDVSDDFSTLAELTAAVRDKIRREKEKSMEGDIADKIMLKLVEAHPFEVPARLVAFEIDAKAKDFEENLKRQNLTLEAIGLSREKLAESYRETSERQVRGEFILKKIAEVEGVKLTNDDIANGYSRIAAQYGMKIDEVKEYFKGRNNMMPFMNELLNEKILEFLRQANPVKFVTAEAQDGGGAAA